MYFTGVRLKLIFEAKIYGLQPVCQSNVGLKYEFSMSNKKMTNLHEK